MFAVNLKIELFVRAGAKSVLGCGDISNASIITFGDASTSMALELTNDAAADGCRLLHTRVPGRTIAGSIGVVVFSVPGEYQLRSSAAMARKSLERLRVAARTKTLAAQERSALESLISAASVKCQAVQAGPLHAEPLSDGAEELASIANDLDSELRNVTATLTKRALADRAVTVAAAESALLALAAAPPPGTKWLLLSPGALSVPLFLSVSVAFGSLTNLLIVRFSLFIFCINVERRRQRVQQHYRLWMAHRWRGPRSLAGASR